MNAEINPLSVESFDKMPFFSPINLVAANNGRKWRNVKKKMCNLSWKSNESSPVWWCLNLTSEIDQDYTSYSTHCRIPRVPERGEKKRIETENDGLSEKKNQQQQQQNAIAYNTTHVIQCLMRWNTDCWLYSVCEQCYRGFFSFHLLSLFISFGHILTIRSQWRKNEEHFSYLFFCSL